MIHSNIYEYYSIMRRKIYNFEGTMSMVKNSKSIIAQNEIYIAIQKER